MNLPNDRAIYQSVLLSLVLPWLIHSTLPAAELPRVLLSGWKIELVRSEPELVTPVGCRFDQRGRLFVVECHTHFPPDHYQGPKSDRIYLFQDTNGDGTLDSQKLFFEGGKATMGIAISDDGWIYLVTRSEIKRIRDRDGDDKAEQEEVLIRQETTADYPHNGLSSIVFDSDGWLYFGQGENFGQPYKLIGPKDSIQEGGGEGGNLFRCRKDGSQLERVATGFWNPFGTCFDRAGRLWTVENDPDARPPCRLIHVVESGDYGFQFRFGRAGTHPLLAWNGELPGTLPMAAGTGEAPCAVMPVGDHLWVTSWGDNRLERFSLIKEGATWRGSFEPIVQGDVTFRPVDMATAPDGSIYVTDWVDRSYPVHSKGRLWRLVPPAGTSTFDRLPDRSTEPWAAISLSKKDQSANLLWEATRSDDLFVVQQAIATIANQKLHVNYKPANEEKEMLAWLQAWRWSELCDVSNVKADSRRARLSEGLRSSFDSVRRLCIRYAAETGDKALLEPLQGNLARDLLSTLEFKETIAAISYLETGSASPKARDPQREKYLLGILSDKSKSSNLRALALSAMPSETKEIAIADLMDFIKSTPSEEMQKEAILFLGARPSSESLDALLELGKDQALPLNLRALAISAMGRKIGSIEPALIRLRDESTAENPIRKEIERVLNTAHPSPKLPEPTNTDAWMELVGTGGDPVSGQRVWLRSVCINCHSYQGRGSLLGPELSTLKGSTTRRRLLESILEPSREIGPLYSTWRVLTAEGRVLVGAKLNGGGVGTNLKYLAADGSTFELKLSEIVEQQPSSLSIMPADTYQGLSIDELRDLLAFLE